MFTFYKQYRISTEVRGKFGIFEVYQPNRGPQPNRFEATGYVMDDLTGYPLDGLAEQQAKNIIDAAFETTILGVLRTLPRY